MTDTYCIMNTIAVDVGTTSVRLAIISFRGEGARESHVLASHKRDIDHRQDGNQFEQSSRHIWAAICECSQECLRKSNVSSDSIKSIAFSATCSLVIEGDDGNLENDIIMWMDHRSILQAQKITASGSKVLNQFGGVCSPEFSLSKLVWLKENEPERFSSATGFFELPDWLVYRCIGDNPSKSARSLCSLVCKWGYDFDSKRHCDIIESLGSKLVSKVGELPAFGPGTVAGYLDPRVAQELGLIEGPSSMQDKENFKPLRIAVGTSLIDAHAGMLAMLSIPLTRYNIDQRIESTICSLAGTSSCNMLLSKERKFTRGIWGPYRDVVIQGYYLLEAGQSLTGKLIEINLKSHQEGKKRLNAGEKMYDIITNLNEQALSDSNPGTSLHVLPTFHGSRSPLANPRLRGGIYGLSAEGTKSLLEYYMATVESLAYETKFIIETLGIKLDTILVSGGLMKNKYYMQTLANVLKCKVVRMSLGDIDFMVMGSGLVARHAALAAMSDQVNRPLTKESIELIHYQQLDVEIYAPIVEQFCYHEKKYRCYKEFVDLSQRIDKIMH